MLQTIERLCGADWTNGAFGKEEDVSKRAGAPEAVRPEKGDRTVRRIQPAERCCRPATIASSAPAGPSVRLGPELAAEFPRRFRETWLWGVLLL